MIELHRLPTPGGSVLHLATFHFPAFDGRDFAYSIASGANIAPGESGIVALSSERCMYLMEIADLVEILYSSNAADSGEARVLDESWVTRNMFKMKAPRQGFYSSPKAVSGWRCALMTLTGPSHWRGRQDSMQFVDASFLKSSDDANELPEYRMARWGAKNRYVVVYEHPFEAYLNPQIVVNPIYRWDLGLDGGRMLLSCQPERQSEAYPDAPTFYVRVWRL